MNLTNVDRGCKRGEEEGDEGGGAVAVLTKALLLIRLLTIMQERRRYRKFCSLLLCQYFPIFLLSPYFIL